MKNLYFALVVLALAGCELFEKEVKPFEKCPLTLTQRGAYSNANNQEVGVVFEAFDCNNEPFTITNADITGYETVGGEQKPLRSETKAALYSIKGTFAASAILVLDTSGSITQDATVFNQLKSAAKAFAQKVLASESQYVSIIVFDGRQYAFLVTTATGRNVFKNYSEVATVIDGLVCGANINPQGDKLCADSSTNLYNAIIAGAQVSQSLKSYFIQQAVIPSNGIYRGNVILFTDGTDEANYVTLEQAKNVISQTSSETNYYTIGLASSDINSSVLKQLGPDGYFAAESGSMLAAEFDKVAVKLNKLANNIKKFAYCTATRNGTVTFELIHNSSNEKISYMFNANNKGTGCPLGTTPANGRISEKVLPDSFNLPITQL
ncbi:MAG: VWA domain-containing protein [Bacteriovoracaceae bacterium]|nr:VWA domain-containing protein [Bacteriovoracaceae bacterium]